MTATKRAGVRAQVEDIEPWYKQFWPWFLFSLPATIVVAGIAMIVMAVRSPFALVDDNYYKRGLGINEDLAASELAAALQIWADIRLNKQHIQVDLDAAHTTEVQLQFIHPTDAGRDQSYDLQQLGPRRFEGQFEQPRDSYSNSQYKVKLTGHSSQGRWTLNSEKRIDIGPVSEQKSIRLDSGRVVDATPSGENDDSSADD